MYNYYKTVYSSLKNHLLAVFNDPYLSTLMIGYRRYATRSIIDLITHLYNNYGHISPSDMAAND